MESTANTASMAMARSTVMDTDMGMVMKSDIMNKDIFIISFVKAYIMTIILLQREIIKFIFYILRADVK